MFERPTAVLTSLISKIEKCKTYVNHDDLSLNDLSADVIRSIGIDFRMIKTMVENNNISLTNLVHKCDISNISNNNNEQTRCIIDPMIIAFNEQKNVQIDNKLFIVKYLAIKKSTKIDNTKLRMKYLGEFKINSLDDSLNLNCPINPNNLDLESDIHLRKITKYTGEWVSSDKKKKHKKDTPDTSWMIITNRHKIYTFSDKNNDEHFMILSCECCDCCDCCESHKCCESCDQSDKNKMIKFFKIGSCHYMLNNTSNENRLTCIK